MKKIIVTIVVIVFTLGIKAQEKSDLDFSVGADLVSSYVWRGQFQTGAAIQPALALNVAGFSLSAWGSVDVLGIGKEVDFTLGYEISGISLALTDYWWAGEGVYKYFTYDSNKTDHLFEMTAGYTLPLESFPLSLSWNTFFSGADKKLDNAGKKVQAYSTYIEATYPFFIKNIALDAAIGLTPWEGGYSAKTEVVNISLKASKEIKLTDSFSLPAFGQIILNPNREGIYFVFGLSL
ncbi:MAG: hypothetical protein LBM08_03495 [Dysgonamonadaceae bacterium]|jgi:hypothetical protein|nr:hypothetical protein [Dysgonamonadaceae bacterium]